MSYTQNLENMGVTASAMESRDPFWDSEPGKYLAPFKASWADWHWAGHARRRLVQLSRIYYYLVDNIFCLMLSVVKISVNKKRRAGVREETQGTYRFSSLKEKAVTTDLPSPPYKKRKGGRAPVLRSNPLDFYKGLAITLVFLILSRCG
jgi:hypothetical protein